MGGSPHHHWYAAQWQHMFRVGYDMYGMLCMAKLVCRRVVHGLGMLDTYIPYTTWLLTVMGSLCRWHVDTILTCIV
jgi:hypothetical protein